MNEDDRKRRDRPDLTKTHHNASADVSQRIGPYRIVQKIGEGGMGEVYQAQQEDPVRRKVALKVIKRGMDTDQVVARFEAERQALALMNHPNVAKVFEAGSTSGGRPYFAMEYVEGVPITEFCDRHRLTTNERLALFMQVCDGVRHAHQNAIIHRDLKPSNVLVATQDGKRVPKIIDFGVAKATAQRLTERTVFTELGQLIGTPEYMSPEQAEMTPEDVDTRTDVYSLGVLLYELLVGALPFDSAELRKAGFDEIRRKIREDEPSKPSTRISTLGAASTDAAKKRSTDPAVLARLLRGDLDWITMKALEKDRTRRYDSPGELAADIGRHLNHEPVIASPPSQLYRMAKFARRHRVGVTVAVASVVLLAGIAARERVQTQKIARALNQASQEARTAKQVAEFLVGLFEVSDPSEARGNSVTAREILDKGAGQIDETLADQPRIQGRLMDTMGNVYRHLGLYGEAERLLGRAVQARKQVLGEDHPDTLMSINNLGVLYWNQGRYDEAEPLYLETLQTRKRVLGEDHPDTLRSMNNLAALYFNQGRSGEAEPLYLETLQTRKRVLGGDHPDTLESMNNLAGLYWNLGRFDDAAPLFLGNLEARRRVLGGDHPDTLESMNNLAALYWNQRRFGDAEPLYLETLETRKRVLGDDHPDTLRSMNNLAVLYLNLGRFDDAEPLYVEALEARKRVLGNDHPDTLVSMGNLGDLYVTLGRLEEAETLLVEAVKGVGHSLPREHVGAGFTVRKYGVCLTALKKYEEAEANLLDAYEILVAAVGADHPQTRKVPPNFVELYEAWGKPDKAAEWRAKQAEEAAK